MKRPFAVVGITYLIAQTAAVLCGLAVTTALFCVTLLCALVVLILYRDRPAWLMPVVLSCAVCFGMNAGHSYLTLRPAQALEGQTVLLSGKVCEAPYQSYGRYYYIIETDKVFLDSMPQSVRFRLSSAKGLDAEYGDGIVTEVSFNYSDLTSVSVRSLLADRVILTGYLPYDAMPEVSRGADSLYGWIIDMRNRFSAAATQLLGDELGGLLTGMFTGDTTGIDNVTLARFRDCGLSHLFSVSGLHLSVLTAVLIVFLRRITPNYRATALMCIPFVLFFMAFSGFSMSIRRAGIMTLLALTAAVVRREYDPMNSLGFAALVICLLNPCAAGDVGMLMSFASTAGIIVLYAPINRRVRSLIHFDPKSRFAFVLRPLIEMAVTSLIAQAATIPIAALCFGQMSLTAPIANLLCIYPATVFMVVGAIASALYCIPFIGAVIGAVLMVPAWIFGRLCTVLTGMIALIPGSGISVNYPFMSLIVGLAVAVLIIWLALFGKEWDKSYSLALCCVLILEIILLCVSVYKGTCLFESSITVFGSDSGIMTSLNSGGQSVIIGCGTDGYRGWLASERLSEENITDVLAVALPDNTATYADYACEVIEQYEPDAVFLSDEGSRYELISQSCSRVGAEIYLADNASYSAEGCGISFLMFTDSRGMMWTWAECRQMSMLICPEQGDCLLLPEEFRYPDVAVMSADAVINATIIKPVAVIISGADTAAAKRAASQLEYRGAENVFAVSDDGFIKVKSEGKGIRVIEQ